MRIYRRVLTCSILSLTGLVFDSSIQAATTDTFNGTGTPAVPSMLGGGSGPMILTEGANSFLRILGGAASENNVYSYDVTDFGAYERINAIFDFRIQPGDNGLADGLSLLLIPTATYGGFGIGPTPTAEEPNVANTFGLAIDVYPGLNNISTHWNGFQVNELNTNTQVNFRDNGVFNRVQVVLERVGNAMNATVTMTPDSLGAPGLPQTVMQTVIPNMLPYENRVQFNARTGGQNMKADIDNVSVSYSNPYLGGLPVAPAGSDRHLFQDFDSIGTTGYRAVQVTATTATVNRPGPLMKPADEGSSGAFLRIVNDGVEGQNARIVFDRAFDGGLTNRIGESLQFDLRFNSPDTPADGMGLVFLPTKDPNTGLYNVVGDGINSSEEPNIAGALGIGFDVYNNGGTDVAPGVSLHYNGFIIADVPLPPEIGLGQFHRVEVTRVPVEGGLNVSVIATPNINGGPTTPIKLLDNIFVAGASNYDYRVQISGRTGGANADHDIDNISTRQLAAAAVSHTHTNFEPFNGAPYKTYRLRDAAPPDILNEFGPNGEFLRLLHDGGNNQANSLVFDKQLDGSVAGATGINASLDFRLSGADQNADGFSLMLIPTSVYGTTGPGAAFSTFAAEEPNLPGVFAVGWDLYNGAGVDFNEMSVHWDNLVYGANNIDPALIDLDSGVFHRMQLQIRQVETGILVDLTLTPDVFGLQGSPIVIFDDLQIPGMSLYDYRVELAARTGGLNMNVDVDNILVQTVPEPGAAAILCAGVGMLALVRRRRLS